MKRLGLVLVAIAALGIGGCGFRGSLPRSIATPTPKPIFGAVGAHQVFTIYAFHNDSGENGLPVSPSSDGAAPKGTLTMVDLGGTNVLFGRTAAGGNSSGCGVFFKLNTNGSGYTLAYSFSGNDGCSPRHDAMILGKLYGLTTEGGSSKDDGTIFAFPL